MNRFTFSSLIILLFTVCGSLRLSAQHVVIMDTIRVVNAWATDSSFTVTGRVAGLDSGTIKLSWLKNSVYVPIRQGSFEFSGFVNSTVLVRFEILSDYYELSFYVEPGVITIQTGYKEVEYSNNVRFRASGTPENDLKNYFQNTLSEENDLLFLQLGNSIQLATEKQDLEHYLVLVDSVKAAEENYFNIITSAIDEKRFGLYLLSAINSFYINYGHFEKRKSLLSRLPETMQNSAAGKRTLAFIERSQRESESRLNIPAYSFKLKDMNGQIISLKQYQGKIVVLDFWASWCVPCIKSLPLLKKIQASKLAEDIVFISVSIDKKADDWRAKAQDLAIYWPLVLADLLTVEKYLVAAVPDYVVISKRGRIVSRGASLASLITTLQKIEK